MANAEGIDISHWQNKTPSLEGRDFVIAKASEGTTPDSRYTRHVRNTRAAGKIIGAYAFNRSDVDIDAQVQAFVDIAGEVDLYALDVEDRKIKDANGNVIGRIPRFTKKQTRAFISKFHALTSKKIGLYMSESIFYWDVGQDWNWVARWGADKPVNSNWQIHQYRGSPLDLDQFNGTADEMRVYFDVKENPDMGFMQVNIPTGTWLFVNKDLSNDNNNVKIDPGRPMLLVAAKTGNGTHQVLYDSNNQVYFVRQSDVTLTPLITEEECPTPECPPPTDADCKEFSDAAYQSGFDAGKIEGHTAGYTEGYNQGHEDGFAAGEEDGTASGIETGVAQEQARICGVLGLPFGG